MVTYVELPASAELTARVTCVWSASHDGSSRTKRVVPDGCIDLIWSASEQSVHVAGPDTVPFHALLDDGERFAGVRFGPGAAPAVLGVPAGALRDCRVPLAELWGVDAVRLADAVDAAADRPRALEALVAGRVRAAGALDPVTDQVVRRLSAGAGVRGLADDLGLSERHLHRRSVQAFGYGPKVLQRILRFQHALQLIGDGAPLALAAHRTGYADQAHLTREVQSLAGVPPSTLAA